MPFFRSKKTQNEILLHEAGLDGPPTEPAHDEPADDTPAPYDPYEGTYPATYASGIWMRAMARPAQYDTMTTAHAPGVAGDKAEFAALPDGDLIVDEETGDAELGAFADAVEKHLRPPYRALARREDGDLWAIAARQIDVLKFSFDGGDGIELIRNEGTQTLSVDGKPWKSAIPALERAGEELGGDFVVHADRLDGDLWEVQASVL